MRFFERLVPHQNPWEDVKRGLSFDAESCLAVDYGRFKPKDRELWTKSEFIVAQDDEYSPIAQKDPTWASYGIDTEYIGSRVNVIIADDLVSLKTQGTPDQRDKVERAYDDVLEARLEPGGLLMLVGQRLRHDDLYKYNTMKVIYDDEGDETERKKYHHIVFRDHYSEKCDIGTHDKDAPAWPKGCLLVPSRITWRDTRANMMNPNYAIVYQQEDGNPGEKFVEKEWADGCKDKGRDPWEHPGGSELCVVATVDPSVANFWACELWAYDPISEKRFLIELVRKVMGANELLDWDPSTHEYTGLMNEWQDRAAGLGLPIQYWIIESNAAHRYLFQYNHFRNWTAARGVEVIAHSTQGANKNSEQAGMGINMVRTYWRNGLYRLPWRTERGRLTSQKLISEAEQYPGRYDDTVMAQWFFEWNRDKLSFGSHVGAQREWRPSWL
jgi:hypothetical protein